jgi:hypothetical protein
VNARDVFFEELEAFTAEALKGIVRILLQSERSLALAVSRISFSFEEFRCTASSPRRPRPLIPPEELDVDEDTAREHFESIQTKRHQEAFKRYQPSGTAHAAHWARWQADVGQILAMCTSLSEVRIYSTHPGYYPRRYHARFPSPDMTNDSVLNGLLHSANLRSLHLVDPVPLERYGPALASWERLKDVTIILTRKFEELQNTAFVPPKALVSFSFQDRSRSGIPWPLASDLAKCADLQVLDLGVTSLAAESTRKAIGFLCVAYQHSLRELTLHQIGRTEPSSFQDILESILPLQFKKLQRLRLPGGSYDTSVFSYFTADKLEYVEVGWLMLEYSTGSREDKWSRALSHSSLRMLKKLVINVDDPDNLRKQALINVCHRLGVTLIFRPYTDSEGNEAEENAEVEFDGED